MTTEEQWDAMLDKLKDDLWDAVTRHAIAMHKAAGAEGNSPTRITGLAEASGRLTTLMRLAGAAAVLGELQERP